MLIKKILVPTDFSAPANYAADLAIKIAPKLSAEVHFYHRILLPDEWDDLTEKERMDYPESLIRYKESQEQLAALEKKYASTNVKVKTIYSSGEIVRAISKYVAQEDIYLIIMGSSGASGVKEWIFGSNAQKIVRKAPCPVMVIKHPPENVEFKKLVFASDFRDSAKGPFKKLIEFGRHFGSQIHLLYVAAYPKFEATEEDMQRMHEFKEMAWKLPCFEHGIGDIDIEMGITHFIKKMRADLVVLTHYGQTPFKRMITGNLTESMVNHLEQPIMTLNTEDVVIKTTS